MSEKKATGARRIRCAVYTRKSSDEGLEREFNTLHAQREACEAYVASQRHEGWQALRAHYDDGGFSGGTLNRPALQRLLADIGAGKMDTVVVYKIDRLTRSLFDFAKIVETFDANGVSFVSVTQAFNTTTSMGRLTLNVLLSFAQFEREVTSERIRDKVAASKQKGMWMGGAVPLGYDAVNRKLRINAEEANTVRFLFDLYLRLGSVRLLQNECQQLGLRTKLRTMLDGRRCGGTAFSRGHLYLILSNPIYTGRIPHKGRSYEGEHEAIIDPATWDKVQAQLETNAGRKRGRVSSKHPSLLAGLLFTVDGVPFTPSHAVNHGRRYRYYVERSLLSHKADKGESGALLLTPGGNGVRTKGWRLPAHEIEQLVMKQMAVFLRDRSSLVDKLRLKPKSPNSVAAVLARACKLADECESGSSARQRELVSTIVRRVTIEQDKVMVKIGRGALSDYLNQIKAGSASHGNYHQPITIEVSVRLLRRGVEAKLVLLDQRHSVSEPDDNLVKALARAHDWFGKIVRGEAKGVGDIARAERIDRSYVTRVLWLAFLAPEIAVAILKGRQSTELTAKGVISSALKVPLLWTDQVLMTDTNGRPSIGPAN